MKNLGLTIFIFISLTIAVSGQKFRTLTNNETTLINAQELQQIVKSSQKKQPLLINFWATWCGPCRDEFPDLVKIDDDYREKGLKFVVVSIDNPALAGTLVSEFLESYEARMPSYLLNLASRREMTKAIRRIAPKFPDGYPFTLLFNTEGKAVYQKTGRINAQTLRQQIDKTLKK